MSRRWRRWPGRFVSEANSASGLFGIGGAGIAATGAVLAAPVVLGLGAALAVGVTVVCAYRAIPPQAFQAADLIGDRITDLSMIEQIDPRPSRIGFVGISRVGKTTLLSNLVAERPPANVRTEDPYATLMVIPGRPPRYAALIDAAGQQYSQQFQVVDEAEHLIVCLDHNSSDAEGSVIEERLRSQDEFLGHLAGHLKGRPGRLRAIHLVLNKRDLWEQTDHAQRARSWVDAQVAHWRMLPGIKVTSAIHSNFNAADTTALVEVLRAWTRRG